MKRVRKPKNKTKREALKNMPNAYDEAVISWVTPEYIRHEKGLLWKIIALTVVVVAAILGILYDAWTFSLAIVVFSIVYYIVHLEHPKNVEVRISDIGVKLGNRQYPFSRIKAFWIIYDPPYVNTFTIRVNGEFLQDITIQLNGQNPGVLREFMVRKVPELEGQSEPFADVLLRLFKL